jgi:hypothetical protein
LSDLKALCLDGILPDYLTWILFGASMTSLFPSSSHRNLNG